MAQAALAGPSAMGGFCDGWASKILVVGRLRGGYHSGR